MFGAAAVRLSAGTPTNCSCIITEENKFCNWWVILDNTGYIYATHGQLVSGPRSFYRLALINILNRTELHSDAPAIDETPVSHP